MPVTTEKKVLIPEDFPESGEKKPRKSPVPQQYERILAGVLKLSLSERVEIAKQVHDSIKNEVADLKQRAEEAAKIAGNGAA